MKSDFQIWREYHQAMKERIEKAVAWAKANKTRK